jgi:hypothetical protein
LRRSPGRDAARHAVLAAALLVGPQVAGKATRDALFLSSFDVSWLPPVNAAAALLSLVATLGFSRAMTRFSPARLLPAAVGASSLFFLAEWALARSLPRAAAVAVYFHQAALGAVLISGFWSLVNERFDPHTAKRAMGAIGAGASLGGVGGGLLTWSVAGAVSIPGMLLILAGASLLGLGSLFLLGAPAHPARPARAAGRPGEADEQDSALGLIAGNAYLRGLALLIGLGALVEALLEYLMGAAAAARYAPGAPLMSFFALFHGGTGLATLLVQAAVVRPALQRAGVAGTLAIQPAFTALLAAVALAAPRLGALVLLRGGQSVLRNSTFRSAYELLYTPLPHAHKRPTKVVVDVAFDRIGSIAGSGLVILVLLLAPDASARLLLAVAFAAAAAAFLLAPRFQRGYVDALAASLRDGATTLEPEPLVEPEALLSLASVHHELPAQSLQPGAASLGGGSGDAVADTIADLRSGDRIRIRRALDGLRPEPAHVAHLLPLLADDGQFELAARALRRVAPLATGQLVDALLDRRLPGVVRRRVPRVLKGVPTQRAADGLLLGLAEDRFDVRYRCAQALSRMRAHAPIALPRERILESVAREASSGDRSPRQLEHVFTLLGLVFDAGPLQTALRALRSGDDSLRGTALEYLDNVLPAGVRETLWAQLGVTRAPAPTGRSPEELRDDLLRSTESLAQPSRRR